MKVRKTQDGEGEGGAQIVAESKEIRGRDIQPGFIFPPFNL